MVCSNRTKGSVIMGKREFVQLAHVLDKKKHRVGGMFASEKLDGERCIWDGGVTRGMLASEVPWANTAKDKKAFYATGLWTRRGKVVHAPASFVDALPKIPLDGELFAGRERFQHLMSVARNSSGTSDWSPIRYMIFDTMPMDILLADGNITDTMFKKTLSGAYQWWLSRAKGITMVERNATFQQRQIILKMAKLGQPCFLHVQEKLPDAEPLAIARLDQLMCDVLDGGGEGMILKNANSLYSCDRTWNMLKYKPYNDMEAEVVGYTTGRETDLGSKLLGKMGALICKIPAGEFKVSGFTDAERELNGVWNDPPAGDFNLTAEQWASQHPDCVCPTWIGHSRFPRGSMVTIKYRELTDAGLPKEGRYFRKFHA